MDAQTEYLLQHLTPDMMNTILGAGGYEDRSHVLEDQLKQAQLLRTPRSQQHITGLGAALGGLGDIVGNITGGLQENKLRGEQQRLLQQNANAMRMLMQARINALRNSSAPTLGAGDFMAPDSDAGLVG